MSYRKRANGGKRDLAEPAIVAALEAYGARIWRLSGCGNPDLLVFYHRRFVVMEIKTGTSKPNANQQDIPWPIVRTIEDAIAEVTRTVASRQPTRAQTARQANVRSCK